MLQILIILSGLPASGKSTWSLNFCKLHSKTAWFNFDLLFPEWHKPANDLPEKDYKLIRRELLDMVRKDLKLGKTIVVDDNNLYKSMRHEFYRLAFHGSYF